MAEGNLFSIIARSERRRVNGTVLILKWLKAPLDVCCAHDAFMVFN